MRTEHVHSGDGAAPAGAPHAAPHEARHDTSPGEALGRTGVQCLVAIARLHGVEVSESQVAHANAIDAREITPRQLVRIAQELGLKAKIKRTDWARLQRIGQALPAIIATPAGHFVVLSGFRETEGGGFEAAIRDPLNPSPDFEFLGEEALSRRWTGEVILLQRHYALDDERQPFGLRWFLPEILRQRSVFRDVGIAAIVLHVLALAIPIFFQLMIDKVVVHEGLSTLVVLTAGILVVIGTDGILGYLRSRLLLHATSKIDIRVATTVFRHLLALPLRFFEKVPAGVLVRHMQQDHTIREFLTGRLFLTLLDASALIVFVPVLFFYSAWLGLLVIGFSALLAVVIGLVSGPFRKKLKALYTAEAERQALLVETIHGIGTVKSLALEPIQRKTWERRSAFAVQRHLDVGRIQAGASAVSTTLDKLMSVAIVCVGVLLVFAHKLTVGELVAFQMLAGRVSGPLVQLVGLINSYQEAALSVRMLGEVMSAAPEPRLDRGLQPMLRGALHFDDVSFAYDGAPNPALSGVGFEVPAGSVVGVVGRSGSGKSTLVRLIQGLEQAQGGLIRLDGHDIREIDKVHLRSQIGVVPQETFLFHGTIRENIALARPEANFAEIVAAARTAGAEEFIERLPQGYDTILEEGAVNLSGGQKQRLAIARALLRQPRILIFDEATSALDPESEAIIQANMAEIARGRTTVVISHRLSSLVHADVIVVLAQGRVVGLGPHDELLTNCDVYRQLWGRQARAFLPAHASEAR